MSSKRKITRAQLRTVGLKLLKAQGGICPLCGKPIDHTIKGELVVDHNHVTGEIRGVLHRSCNSGEGKAFNAIGRWIVGKMDYTLVIPALRRLADYLENSGSDFIYPTHKTDEEKRAARAKKERARRQARAVVRKRAKEQE